MKININCYPLIFKMMIIECYNSKRFYVRELVSIFNVSKSSIYNWIILYNNNKLFEKKKYTKISKYNDNIQKYICKYVSNRVNFDYVKLIRLIKNSYAYLYYI